MSGIQDSWVDLSHNEAAGSEPESAKGTVLGELSSFGLDLVSAPYCLIAYEVSAVAYLTFGLIAAISGLANDQIDGSIADCTTELIPPLAKRTQGGLNINVNDAVEVNSKIKVAAHVLYKAVANSAIGIIGPIALAISALGHLTIGTLSVAVGKGPVDIRAWTIGLIIDLKKSKSL